MADVLPTFTKVLASRYAEARNESLDLACFVLLLTNAPREGRRNRHHVIRLNLETGRARCIGNALPPAHARKVYERAPPPPRQPPRPKR